MITINIHSHAGIQANLIKALGITGGVIGGIVVLGFIGYMVFDLCLKLKRDSYSTSQRHKEAPSQPV